MQKCALWEEFSVYNDGSIKDAKLQALKEREVRLCENITYVKYGGLIINSTSEFSSLLVLLGLQIKNLLITLKVAQ